jgi:hypothetical protein
MREEKQINKNLRRGEIAVSTMWIHKAGKGLRMLRHSKATLLRGTVSRKASLERGI